MNRGDPGVVYKDIDATVLPNSSATDEEKVKLQGSMFAYAGTYMADGEKVVHHVNISWNQSWTGTDLVRFYKLNGNTLTITTARAQSAIDGEEGEFVLVGAKYSRKHKTMQVYAATLGQLVSDGAKLALIFGETPGAPPLAPWAESCFVKSDQ